MKLKSPLMATALASLANAQTPATAIITVEASHGGAGNGLTNTTLSIPLSTQYTNPALDQVSTLYLSGSSGAVEFPSITCYPYRNGNLTGMGGLPFTSETPSRLSTNTVQVGSIMCNSSDLTAGDSPSITSTMSATTTELTRGGTSDVPNLNGTMILSVTSSSSMRSNGTMTPTSTMRTTVPATSAGGAAQETITSVTVITGGSNGPVTSTMVSAVGSSPSSSPADTSSGSGQMGGGQMGAAGERWRVEKWGMLMVVAGALLSAL